MFLKNRLTDFIAFLHWGRKEKDCPPSQGVKVLWEVQQWVFHYLEVEGRGFPVWVAHFDAEMEQVS